MAESVPSDRQIVREIREKFDLGPCFVEAYLRNWSQSREAKLKTLDDILNSPPPACDWFMYAMSANSRGQAFYDVVAPHIPASARRYLDVGCGYGGCLVAFAKHGLEVCGFDIDTGLLQLAEANCTDQGLHGCAHAASVTDSDLVARFGTFDVITSSAVTEHVPDVDAALSAMLNMLNPGGILVLEIPNLRSLWHVATDSHYALFGISLLKEADGSAYHRTFYATAEYDVRDAISLDEYLGKCTALGYSCTTVESGHSQRAPLYTFPRLFMRLRRQHRRYLKDVAPKLSPSLREKIAVAYADYLRVMYEKALCALVGGKRRRQAFAAAYLHDAWTIIVQKGIRASGAPARSLSDLE